MGGVGSALEVTTGNEPPVGQAPAAVFPRVFLGTAPLDNVVAGGRVRHTLGMATVQG